VPEVEAPEGSGFTTGTFGRSACLGRVPDVDGVGDERALLAVVELFEPELGGATGGGAGGAAGEAALEGALVGPSGCSLGTVVQLYWNSGTVSSSPVRNLRCLKFQTLSSIVYLQVLTVQKCFCH
jgi:hypothetical protein